MSEEQYTGLMNAIKSVNDDLQEFKTEVRQEIKDFKQEVKAANDLTREQIKSINERFDHNQHVQNLILANIGVVLGVMTLLFTAIQFAVAYFTK